MEILEHRDRTSQYTHQFSCDIFAEWFDVIPGQHLGTQFSLYSYKELLSGYGVH